MGQVFDSGQVILARIAARDVERARLEAETAADMLAFRQLRHAESEAAPHAMIRDLERSYAVDELASSMRMSVRTVGCRLAEFERVRDGLPATWAMFAAGVIDGYRASIIASGVLGLPDDRDVLRRFDDQLVRFAPTRTTTQLQAKVRRFVVRWGVKDQDVRGEHDKRRVVLDHGRAGHTWVNALLPTDTALALDKELTRRAKNLPADDPRTFDQARADLLVEWLFDTASDTASGAAPSRKAVIGVVVGVSTLAGYTDEPGESFDGSFALPADMVRDLACQPGTLFHRIITSPRGQILDVTEIGYVPSGELRTAIEIRDGTCKVAHCTMPVVDCDIDHELPHPRGPTSGPNLRGLCRRHHRQKTHLTVDPVDLSMQPEPHQCCDDLLDLVEWVPGLSYVA